MAFQAAAMEESPSSSRFIPEQGQCPAGSAALIDEEWPRQSCVTPRSWAGLGAAGSSAVKQPVAALGAARIYAPQEQLYLSSVKSLIYRQTPSGKAISLQPAMLGIYNCCARDSSSLLPQEPQEQGQELA